MKLREASLSKQNQKIFTIVKRVKKYEVVSPFDFDFGRYRFVLYFEKGLPPRRSGRLWNDLRLGLQQRRKGLLEKSV